MDRIVAPGTTSTPDAPPSTGTPGHWTSGVPGTSAATTLPGYFLEGVQEELIAVIVAAGETPSRFNNAQLLAAIQALISNASATWHSATITLGTTYTNTYGKPITISAYITTVTGNLGGLMGIVNGIQIATNSGENGSLTTYIGISFVVPAGQTYEVGLIGEEEAFTAFAFY